MKPTYAVLLMAAAWNFADTAPAPDPEAKTRFQEHMNRVQRFSCSQPRERAVPASHVKQLRVLTNQTVYPPVTVLRLCDASAGCCLNAVGYTCGPAPDAISTVPLYFSIVSNDGHTRLVKVEAEQHDRCECRSQDEEAPPQ